MILPEFGNCYTFNSGKLRNGSKVFFKKSYLPGTKNGLSLTLWTGVSSDLMKSKGIVLSIHNTSATPFSADLLELTTGFKTGIAVRQENIIKLPKPYNNCYLDDTYDLELFTKTLSLFGVYQQN